ncbi:MAG: hypothetical protein RL701_2312 [Pseudomonadota bacterium]|jgi:hypothetical protein
MRLFFSSGLQDCAAYDTADPVLVVLGQFDPTVFFPAAQYTAGLKATKQRYLATHRLGTYFMGAPTPNLHEHLFRPRFYTAAAGDVTIANFVRGFVAGKVEQVGGE